MSKRDRLRPAAAVAAAFVLAACAFWGGARGVGAQAVAPQAAVNPKAASVAATLDEVLKETSEIRGLAVLRPVKSGAQSRAEIERMLLRRLEEDKTTEKMRAGELSAKKFGLLPADFQLRPFLVSLLTEQILGYYDPKTQHFYLADWIEVDGQRPVMAHELTHALQDQHFDLRRFEKWPDGDSDAELAAHALVEGDASLAMMLYVMRDFKRAAGMLRSASASSPQLDRAPRALRESLVFPYDKGLEWATQIYRRGGWAAVSAAYKELPQSTEQILHVDKYLAREAPVKVELTDLAASLGAGWKQIDSDVNGEWGYYLVLDQFLKDDKLSRRAAAGWAGDRYALYQQAKTGETLLAHVSVWDTEEDAQEFFDAYVARTERRYTPASAETKQPDAARRVWRTAEGLVTAERQGARVLVFEGLPARANAAELSKKLGQ
ncbi:MAG TPA: hypothetical protein VK421_13410 [Pyrinomonadaceae bacterium]|nr:hypothetical protein [Pyrinomonadaceae bacterium]